MYEHFLKKRVDVDDADKEMTVRLGQSGRRGPMLDPSSGRVAIVGLDGGGKEELGRALAAELGMELAIVDAGSGPEVLDAAGRVYVPRQEAVADDAFRARLKESCVVFYLINEAGRVQERLRERGNERPMIDIGADLGRLEGSFMESLHFLLRADKKVTELTRDVRESLRL